MSGQPRSDQAQRPAKAPKPKRATQVGVVRTSGRDKTIKVAVPYTVRHAKYGKFLRRDIVLQAHDEKNECREGDVVEVMQCRPISRTKSWRLVRIVKRAPEKVATTADKAGVVTTPEVPS